MKKIPIILGFLILTLGKSYGQDTIYTIAWTPSMGHFFDLNDRDTTNKYIFIDTSQINNIWQLGTPSKTIFNAAYSNPLAFVTDTINTYPNNNTSSFSFIVFTDCNYFEINFWHRINSDSLKDGGVIEYSLDGGSTWNNIINSGYTFSNFYSSTDSIVSNLNKPGFSGTSGWIQSLFQGPTLNNLVEYRFTFTSDSINTNKDGWIIDNIAIGGIMVGVNDISSNTFIQIFPNPSSSFFTIKMDNMQQLKSVLIKDILGKTILTSNQSTIDLSSYEIGVYFLEITTDNGKFIKRVVRK